MRWLVYIASIGLALACSVSPPSDSDEAPVEARNRFEVHGRVGVSEDGAHFEHSDGTPFFWLADTAWNGALMSSEQDWNDYLADRKAKGFTAIQVVTTQWRTAPTNAEGQVAYRGRDPIEINPEFFGRIDERLQAINDHGMLAVPVLLWGLGDEEYTPGKLPTEQAARLARYQVDRYERFHVIWFLGGDSKYDEDQADHWRAIGRSVFEDGPDHAPVFLHPRGRHWPWADYADEAWLSALGYQSGHGDNDETLAWIHSGPPTTPTPGPARPIINLEPNYEDHISYHKKVRHSAYNVRRAAYWSLLNTPTAGVTYGGHGIWSWQSGAEVPRDHGRSGVAKPWREAMQLPGSGQMKHLAECFTSIDWWNLRPAPELLGEQPGEIDPAAFVSASRSAVSGVEVYYAPAGAAVRRAGAASGAATFVDPRSGRRQPASGGETGLFQPPSEEDWLLLLQP